MQSGFLAVAAVTLLTIGSAFAQPAPKPPLAAHPMPVGELHGGQLIGGTTPTAPSSGTPMPGSPVAGHHSQIMQMDAMATGPMPTLPGQDAFAAVQEIVSILEADPNTDWSKVNLDRLREHLIDMNEVTLHAAVAVQPVDGGIEAAVTGTGRTLEAIQRMVPDQAQELNGQNGWQVRAETRPDGVTLFVTSSDAKQVAIIRGLGFIGVMATGTHHQMHHLMMAKGMFAH